MKKTVAWIIALMVAFVFPFAVAEQEESFFARFDGFEWSFYSGAGGWSVDFRILPDGTFSGSYHDSDMGDAAEDYPDGTLYLCSFTGRFSLAAQTDENSWILRVDELAADDEPGKESIEDGTRVITTEPCGLSAGDEMTLYRPGTPVNGFSEDMQFFAHLLDQEEAAAELDTWFLWSDRNQSGFTAVFYDSPSTDAP